MPKEGQSRKPGKKAATDSGTTPETPGSPNRAGSSTTIGALVSNLHHNYLQSLHQPLLESEERVLSTHRSPSRIHPHTRQFGTELKPHSSLPRFVIDIEEETDAAVAEAEAETDGKPISSQEQDDHANQSPSRRFSHFNLALRRFSHIHVHVNANYPGRVGVVTLLLCRLLDLS